MFRFSRGVLPAFFASILFLCMLVMTGTLAAQDEATYITYISGVEWIGQLYMMNTTTGEATLMPTGVDRVTLYDWSPDGQQIAFSDGGSIYTMQADGANRKQLMSAGDNVTEPSYGVPVWSPDGKRLAFIQYGNQRYVKIIDVADPNQNINLSMISSPPIIWSPDGNSIGIYGSGTAEPNFVIVTGLNDCSPPYDACVYPRYDFTEFISGWSPDGNRLAVSNAYPCCTLVIKNIDLKNPTCADPKALNCALFESGVSPDRSTSSKVDILQESMQGWSSDSQELLLISNRSGTNQIYVMDADDGELTQLTEDPTRKLAAHWSPDEKQIVYLEYESDYLSHGSISLMNADGTDIRMLAEIDTPVWDIQWRPE